MKMRFRFVLPLVCCAAAAAQPSDKLQGMLQRIFNSSEVVTAGRGGRGGGGGGAGCFDDDSSSTIIERGEIARSVPGSTKRKVLAAAANLPRRGPAQQ